MGELFSKLPMKWLKEDIEIYHLIPDHQLGFREKHFWVIQIHRILKSIQKVISAQQYFWTDHKRSTKSGTMDCYLNWRNFAVKHGKPLIISHRINSEDPQGSILGPLLYIINTSDIPENINTTIASFADNKALLSCHGNFLAASENHQQHLYHLKK